jgi:Flp pilus assembly protein TadD
MHAIPRLSWLVALLLLLALVAEPVCAQPQERPSPAAAIPSATAPGTEKLPKEELTDQILYQFLIAEIALQRGHTELAAQTYLDLAKRTRDPRIAQRAVEVAEYARMPQLALESAEIWEQADPESRLALQMVTALLIRDQRVEDAEPYLAKLLGDDPKVTANGFMQLNRLLAGNSDKAQNLRVVQKLAQKYPDLPQAHFAIAQAAVAAKDDSLALGEAQKASALSPDWELAAIFEAELLQRSSAEAAEARLADFLAKHPDSREVRLAYARLLVTQQRYAEAREQFEKLLAQHPDDKDVVFAVGLLAAQLKDYATAESNLKKLLALGYRDPNGVRYALGQIEEEQKKWPEAINWYEQVGSGEQYIPARVRVAEVLAKEGKLGEAREYLHNVKVSDEGQRAELVIAEAQLLREAGRYQEAFDVLAKALEASPEQPDLLYDYALAADKIGRYDLVESSLRELIKLRPDYAHAYNALGYSLADRNERLPEARKLIEKALQLAPRDSYIIDSMGWVLYRMGDLKAAASELEIAWKGQQDAEIGAHLGEVLWVMGKHQEAESIWDQALKNGPDNATLHKTIERFTAH